MDEYIINEVDFTDRDRAIELERMLVEGELMPIGGVVKHVSYGRVEYDEGKALIGPDLIIQLDGKTEIHGLAFEGSHDLMDKLLKSYGIRGVGSLLSRRVECYVDPETDRIFAIKC